MIGIVDATGQSVATYRYDAWGNYPDAFTFAYNPVSTYNPLRYRGYVYDRETGHYYLQSRYYNPKLCRFINADNNFSNYNLFLYCGGNPVTRADKNGEHWYFLWIDDLIEWGVKQYTEFVSSVTTVAYGETARQMSYTDPHGAKQLWDNRPFQEVSQSQEMMMSAQLLYAFIRTSTLVVDVSASISIPATPFYVKAGISAVQAPAKNIDATYVHVGGGLSTPSVLPVSISYSVGIVNRVKVKDDYAGSFFDVGAGTLFGMDYCWYKSSAFSFTTSNSYGIYGGYDYYWCID